MKTPRFSLRTLLIVIAVVCVVIASDQIYTRWYRTQFTYFHDSTVLRQIQNGDSFDDVASKFDELEPCFEIGPNLEPVPFPNLSPGRLEPTANWPLEVGDTCYLGYQYNPADVFDRRASKIIFRDNKLIRWIANEPEADAELSNNPVPHAALRYGFLPFAAIALLIGSGAYLIATRKQTNAGQQKR